MIGNKKNAGAPFTDVIKKGEEKEQNKKTINIDKSVRIMFNH